MGLTKQSINQHLARADAIGDDINRVVGTSLDKGVELDALAKLPEPEREELIERAAAGEQVSARPKAAKPTKLPKPAAPPPAPPAPADTTAEDAYGDTDLAELCAELQAAPSIVAFVLSANLHRRHMTPGQQAAIVASAQDWAKAHGQGGDRRSDQSATLHFDSASERAVQSGASLRTQKMADKVEGRPCAG